MLKLKLVGAVVAGLLLTWLAYWAVPGLAGVIIVGLMGAVTFWSAIVIAWHMDRVVKGDADWPLREPTFVFLGILCILSVLMVLLMVNFGWPSMP